MGYQFDDSAEKHKKEFCESHNCREIEFSTIQLETAFNAFDLPGHIWDHPRLFEDNDTGLRRVLLHSYVDSVMLANHPRFMAMCDYLSEKWKISVCDARKINAYWHDETFERCMPFMTTIFCESVFPRNCLKLRRRNSKKVAREKISQFKELHKDECEAGLRKFEERKQELIACGKTSYSELQVMGQLGD